MKISIDFLRKHFITLIIGFLFLTLILLDWTSLVLWQTTNAFSFIPKYLLSAVIFVSVWFIPGEKISRRDNRYLRIAFLLIFLADTCMVLFASLPFFPGFPFFLLGLGFFLATHIFLILRLTPYLKQVLNTKLLPFALLGLFIFGVGIAVFFQLYDRLISNGLLVPVTAYLVVLSVSLWMGISSVFMDSSLPRKTVRFISIGMVLHYLCDYVIALTLVENEPRLLALLFALIWVFYAPCIYLLSQSGRK